MSDKGFVKIDREIMEHWVWEDKPFSKGQAWIDLILLANHKDVKRIQGGKVVMFKRGTVNRSILSLAKRWGWNPKKVRNFINTLKNDEMVLSEGTTQGTTIIIENYGKFQNKGQRNGQQSGQHEGQRWDNGVPTNKNDKNEKNEKEKTFPVSEYGFDPSEEMTPEQLDIYFKWKKANDVAI